MKKQNTNLQYIKKTNDFYSHVAYDPDIKATKEGSETLLELFEFVCRSNPEKDFIGFIENEKLYWLTYKEILERTTKLSRFLKMLVSPKETIGIYSVNRPEWIITEQAIYMVNCVNCPLYSTFGIESLKHILNETEMKVCLMSGLKAISFYKEVLQNTKTHLTDIICYDELDSQICKNYKSKNIRIHFLEDILNEDFVDTNLKDYGRPGGEDLATICYTSGTSGCPKGVLQTHRNFISTVSSFTMSGATDSIFSLNDSDVYISYLPLAHVMERIIFSVLMHVGSKIAFYNGNPKRLQTDMKIIKPTFFAGVPRVFDVFKEKIMEKINEKNFFLRFIFNLALRYKIYQVRKGNFICKFLDKYIFNKVKEEFGGKIRACLSGSAPLSPSVCEFLQAVLSCPIIEGYGQTEAIGANILKPTTCPDVGVVGIPFPVNAVKLIPWDKYPGGTEGEILLKGPNITKGYYKKPDLTEETFTKDGWLRTGDIGSYSNGNFKIIGRRKEIFKTSLGEYIIPEKVETALKGGILNDILIVGREFCNYIIGLVVCTDCTIDLEEIYKKTIEMGNKKFLEGGLTRFEIPSKIIVLRKEFDTFGEFVTPTGKKKRSLIEKYFEEDIDNCFNGTYSFILSSKI
ncbi:long-chain-fatty-acid-CoA ligase [Hamiltosporidium tvaerminnensis]|uniref:Long-chain-fatty-acid-CoA ligase n=1 Tax=Hamiltosporidium tvaerminnensis TaxID=1176355 RepID=A0A4Q9LUZ0_9MICR|nr:long-chain-fatty-acid-CoA ligase [Hamiltosporidium tvaerminnensis]TBU15843.1 long-chain-fatty-acid-CoA ligase [Hamiltosporidium tvaerminnensis]